ncbi:MAG: hypothetical protein PHD97_05455 [Bacteroidales bacterium]|nr:hypothetical protein [Bacteroidales bacterium]
MSDKMYDVSYINNKNQLGTFGACSWTIVGCDHILWHEKFQTLLFIFIYKIDSSIFVNNNLLSEEYC